jgi:hypothetical protein
MAPKWLKKNSLKNRDDQRTNAAELTLRQSIYPIVLVTILFFLWVSDIFFYNSTMMFYALATITSLRSAELGILPQSSPSDTSLST